MGREGSGRSLGSLVEEAALALDPRLRPGPEALERFEAHAALIARWSARVRLVGDPSVEALAVRHFVDSLTVCLVMDPPEGTQAIDVGSGAGFPGLVLAAVWPQVHFRLYEVDQRKAAFLNAAVAGLELKERVRVVGRGLEGDPAAEGIEAADLILSRAVRGPERLLGWLSPYRRPGGRIVGMLGPAFAGAEDLAGEEEAANLRRVASWSGELPGEAGQRTVVVWGD
ncbi:MAG: class I SAM-dependent methyltransferase [Deltaproteobacteria bacterium]|nr:class I SAM-dependent methyltransferase [Deltaproteobacteria bacterium]